MKTQLRFLVFFFILSHFAFAQASFRNGYIIVNEGDTIKGLIDYKEGTASYSYCRFKSSDDAEVSEYTPEKIAAYGFFNYDRTFISRTITKNNITSRVFVQVLVRGIISLYFFEGSFWVQKEDGILYELTDTLKKVYVNESEAVRHGYEYIAILNMLMSDCPNIGPRIEHTKLLQKSLTDLSNYYNCKDNPATTYEEKRPWSKLSYQLIAGAAANQLRIHFLEVESYRNGAFATTVTPTVGLGLNLTFPRSERLSVITGLFYTSYKTHFERTTDFSYSEYFKKIETEKIKLSANEFRVPLGFQYTHSDKQSRVYYNGGINYIKALSNWESQVTVEQRTETTNSMQKGTGYIKNLFGGWVGCGVEIGRVKRVAYFVELRTSYARKGHRGGVYNQVYRHDSLIGLQVLLGVRLR